MALLTIKPDGPGFRAYATWQLAGQPQEGWLCLCPGGHPSPSDCYCKEAMEQWQEIYKAENGFTLPREFPLVPVDSSNIAAIGYNPNTLVLEVQFSSGLVYPYFHVPPDLHRRLMEAESIGKFFAREVKPIHLYGKPSREDLPGAVPTQETPA